jgi:membrane protein
VPLISASCSVAAIECRTCHGQLMKLIDPRTTYVLTNPFDFSLRVLKAFQANQGLLLAGAVAYYALLSIVPLLILMVIALSQVMDPQVLLATVERALEYVVPGEAGAVVVELKSILNNRAVIGWVLLFTMLFFSSLGFKVLESAISVIFLHRFEKHKRHFVVSLLLPFGYIIFIGTVLFVGSFLIIDLLAIGGEKITIFGHSWSLSGFSSWLIYFAGVLGEILLISGVYYFMPVGRLTTHHALVGGISATVLWEIIRNALGWYFGTLSQVSLVYGSLTTAIVVLLSLEVAATLLLLGAQVIAEYENIDLTRAPKQPVPMRAEEI